MKKKQVYLALIIIFVGFIVAFTILLIDSTINYIEFYPSLEEINLEAPSIDLMILQEKTFINLTLTLSYNSNYRGIKIRNLNWKMGFVQTDQSYMELIDSTHWWTPQAQLEPNTRINLTRQYQFNNTATEIQALIHTSQNQNNIEWLISSSILLDTFLEEIRLDLDSITINNPVK
jgi:hypothetical protein